ncbi:Golgin imh1 [Neocucurbitaria cava]|uniref:Golgin imh1 n=1 Tax=Neocucurbitaria cava TaxID=798079 RepID=A0A9W9CRM3_9PLEO|nr:Golgin imh1 [Neocucurbitaria cava]
MWDAQRIRGAIDARIAEEQARQKAGQSSTPPRSSSAPRRSSSRNLSPSKRPARSKDGDNSKTAPAGKGPDPSEFDPEFVIGEEDEQPSRVGTPRPKEKAQSAEPATENGNEEKEVEPAAEADEKKDKEPELPPEVQTRLRKLDKLEPKYSGEYSSEPLMDKAKLGGRTAPVVPHRTRPNRRNRNFRVLFARVHAFDIDQRLFSLCRILGSTDCEERHADGGAQEGLKGARWAQQEAGGVGEACEGSIRGS